MRVGPFRSLLVVMLALSFPVAMACHPTQNDANSGGDASDDPQNPTWVPQAPDDVLSGTLHWEDDRVDAYSFPIPGLRDSIDVTLTPAAPLRVSLQLRSPSGLSYTFKGHPGGPQTAVITQPEPGNWTFVVNHLGPANTTPMDGALLAFREGAFQHTNELLASGELFVFSMLEEVDNLTRPVSGICVAPPPALTVQVLDPVCVPETSLTLRPRAAPSASPGWTVQPDGAEGAAALALGSYDFRVGCFPRCE